MISSLEILSGRFLSTAASVIEVLAMHIDAAYVQNASDIHLDPTPAGVRVRFRIDGRLTERNLLPLSLHAEVIARIKVLAGLRTDEHFAAQDGRFRHDVAHGGCVDVRVSIAPTYHGENAVLRLLPDTARNIDLEMLGFSYGKREAIERLLRKPDGMVLVTGPTGSGKTTTLYALLQSLHEPERAIVTIEDPIEYAIDGVKQIQAQPRTGLTFARGLRAILRQDPDVIMVGEIRDSETASIAVNTALTGHLLLSTLHTNDAATTIPRLFDLGVEPFLVASTLRLVIAQRLVRLICPECRIVEEPPASVLERFAVPVPTATAWARGAGCSACNGTGYKGRGAISEEFVVSDLLRDAMIRRADARELRAIALSDGMRSIAEEGLSRAAIGETTIEEVLRVCHA